MRVQYLDSNEQPPEPERLTRMLLALLDSQAAYRSLQQELEAELRSRRMSGVPGASPAPDS